MSRNNSNRPSSGSKYTMYAVASSSSVGTGGGRRGAPPKGSSGSNMMLQANPSVASDGGQLLPPRLISSQSQPQSQLSKDSMELSVSNCSFDGAHGHSSDRGRGNSRPRLLHHADSGRFPQSGRSGGGGSIVQFGSGMQGLGDDGSVFNFGSDFQYSASPPQSRAGSATKKSHSSGGTSHAQGHHQPRSGDRGWQMTRGRSRDADALAARVRADREGDDLNSRQEPNSRQFSEIGSNY